MQCTELRSQVGQIAQLARRGLGVVRGRRFSKDALCRPPAIARVSVIEVRQVAERACQEISRAERVTQAGRRIGTTGSQTRSGPKHQSTAEETTASHPACLTDPANP